MMENLGIWAIILGVIGLVVIVVILSKPKCPKCGARKSYSTSRKEIKSERISIKKKETIKHYSKENSNSVLGRPSLGSATPVESVSTREYTVPGIRTYYDVKYTCQACGEIYIRSEYEDAEI